MRCAVKSVDYTGVVNLRKTRVAAPRVALLSVTLTLNIREVVPNDVVPENLS